MNPAFSTLCWAKTLEYQKYLAFLVHNHNSHDEATPILKVFSWLESPVRYEFLSVQTRTAEFNSRIVPCSVLTPLPRLLTSRGAQRCAYIVGKIPAFNFVQLRLMLQTEIYLAIHSDMTMFDYDWMAEALGRKISRLRVYLSLRTILKRVLKHPEGPTK